MWHHLARDDADQRCRRGLSLSGVLSLLSQLTPGPVHPAAPRPARLRIFMITPDLRGHTVLALHAHPDDESIFTGITLRRLAEAGARTVLVVATAGELGESRVPLQVGETVPERRVAELERAAELLGVSRLVLLGHRDSGLPGWPSGHHARAFSAADPVRLARTVAELADDEGAGTLIHDDEHGIYGHPDHRAAHRIGATAADLVGATAYRMTVDREHLHVSARDRHLVHGAARAADVAFGRVTAEITLAVGGTAEHLACKRAAIEAHASQVDPATLPAEHFAAAYGYEWYRRTGAPGVVDALGNAHLVSHASTSGTLVG
ncbi:MAG: PIG-L family deacetylase [Pseudonocardia sp.]|uniref:PIG-L family deacetylase n=2 Tax=unclassified Pseudonocardia TaxID=2619320 RepID=UPI001AC5BB10|nr:PIG-L family deacetylase [Pseudonocardia sp.]MBN9101627.1 PIG-L family deacetylase [Pseudonocardia sp.]